MATSVKTIFKAAQVPIEWEQFDLTGYTDSKDITKLQQALDSIRRNKVALKGIERCLKGLSGTGRLSSRLHSYLYLHAIEQSSIFIQVTWNIEFICYACVH